MRRSFLVGIAALTLLFFATPSFAGFAISATGSGGGTAALISPPSSALGVVSTAYQVWNESSGLTTSPSFTLENNGAVGSYSGLSPGTSTTIASGTPYGSTMIQLNPGINAVVHSGDAIITFSSKIIGIALSGTTGGVAGSLDVTDKYGAPTTTYPTGYTNPSNNRGIIGKSNDLFTISSGGTVLDVKLTANFDGFKELRVFTAGTGTAGVPEPASLVVWSIVGAVVAGRSLRRQRPAI